jgi:hypothetical protein
MRRDGLVVGAPFFVIQVFDSEGYYSSCVGVTEDEVCRGASERSLLSLMLFSVPFAGSWKGETPVITSPWTAGGSMLVVAPKV